MQEAQQRRSRCALVAVLAVLMLQYSSSEMEAAGDHSALEDLGTPQEFLDTGSAPDRTVSLSDVNRFARGMTRENAKLAARNKALRVEQAIMKAKHEIRTAGGFRKKESKAAKKAAKKAVIPPKKELQPVISKGLKVMDKFLKNNNAMEKKLAMAEAKIDAMRNKKAKKAIKTQNKVAKLKLEKKFVRADYRLIPFFKFMAGSKTIKTLRKRAQCQEVCDRQMKCKSYSWSSQTKTCVWSVDSVVFDPHFSLHFKATVSTDGDPRQKWRSFHGVKYIADSGKPTAQENVSMEQCQRSCQKDTACKSYSYKASSRYCTTSTAQLSYDADYKYYEKSQGHLRKMEAKLQAEKDARLAALKAAEKLQKKTRQQQEDAERKKDRMAKRSKERWAKNLATKTAEKKAAKKVQLQVAALDAKLTAKKAVKADLKEQQKLKSLESFTLASNKKITQMESQLRGLRSASEKAAAAVKPVAAKESAAKAAATKLDTKLAIVKINKDEKAKEAKTDKKAATAAKAASEPRTAAAVKAAAQAADCDVKKAKKEVKKLASKKDQSKSAAVALKTSLQKAERVASLAKASLKKKEAEIKVGIKKEKTAVDKQKLIFAGDSVKTGRDQMVAMRAREKQAKIARANAKLKHWELGEELKRVTDAKERQTLERKLGNANGELWKATGENARIVDRLMRRAKKIARAKEQLHKAAQKVKKDKEKTKVKVKTKAALMAANALPQGVVANSKPKKAAPKIAALKKGRL